MKKAATFAEDFQERFSKIPIDLNLQSGTTYSLKISPFTTVEQLKQLIQ